MAGFFFSSFFFLFLFFVPLEAKALSTFVPAAKQKLYQKLLETYAPVWVQEIKAKPLYDIPTNVDFDANDTGVDNVANAETYPLPAHVYSAVVAETIDSYYLFYGVYHIKDYDTPIRSFFFKDASHDNDYEGAMLMIDKSTGGVLALETWYHNLFLQFANSLQDAGNQTIDGKINLEDKTHPILFVQSMGHGIRAFQKLDEDKLDQISYKIYRLGKGTPDVKQSTDRCLTYTLMPFDIFIKDAAGPFDDSSLFTNAYNFGIGPNPLGKFISGPYQGDGWAHPKPPWSWFDKFDTFRPGSWFFHPATVFNTHFSLHKSHEYVYNLGAQYLLKVPNTTLNAWVEQPSLSFFSQVPSGFFHRPFLIIRNFLYRITEFCFYYFG